MNRALILILPALFLIVLMGCATTANRGNNTSSANNTATNNTTGANNGGDAYNPVVDPANFVGEIDNKYYPLAPGTTWVYDGMVDGETEKNEVVVTNQTKTILGVTTTVIRDRVWDREGDLKEETYDWYAQDKEGNVWYFGEDAKEYDNGAVVSTEGSWESGKNGAKPGLIMTASPKTGDSWRQEYLKGEAEDMAEVLGVSVAVTVPTGAYAGCVKTKDWTPLQPEVIENKIYCQDVGIVLDEVVEGGSEKMELTSVKHS